MADVTAICLAVRRAQRMQLEHFHEQLPLIRDEHREPWLLSDGRLTRVASSPEGHPSPRAAIAEQTTTRRGEAVSRRPHKPEIAGSTPAGAITTTRKDGS